jgi:hypothetical protein
MPDRSRTFRAAVHSALAMELAGLVFSSSTFEAFWKRPRRTGLVTALRVLAQGATTAWLAEKVSSSLAKPHP